MAKKLKIKTYLVELRNTSTGKIITRTHRAGSASVAKAKAPYFAYEETGRDYEAISVEEIKPDKQKKP